MQNDMEAEVKRVEAQSKSDPSQLKRDSTMTGGERAETPQEQEERRGEEKRPKEPPIIQKDVT